MVLATETELQGAYEGDALAGRYIRERFASELHRLLHDRQVAAVQRWMRLRPGATLEIAPGPGRLTRDVRPTGPFFCLEYNQGMIAQGRAACPSSVQWVRGNAFQLPFKSDVFDLAYTFRFIRHFHLEDRRRLYAEVRRVLKPGGRLVMDAVNERLSRPLRDASPQDYPIHDELYKAEDLRRELAEASFDDVRLEPVQKRYRWQYRSQVLLGPRASWLNRLLIRALEGLPGGEGLEWIVACRRA
jgi:ubiquinone/menaquinone biosynthesis C-methylase UbiE